MSRSNPTPPIAFENMLARFPDSPLLSDLKRSLAKTVADYKSAHDDVSRIGNDRTLTEGARLVRQATVVKSKMTAALDQLQSATAQIKHGRLTNEAALKKTLETSGLGEISLATEIRAHVKSLPIAERGKFVQGAVAAGDLPALKAVAGAPDFLSGIPPQIHNFARDHVFNLVAPETLARVETLAAGEAAAREIADNIATSTSNLVDFDSADAIAKTAS